MGLRNGIALRNSVQTSEKVFADYNFEVRNSGGHSSVPSKDNAIYHLAGGLVRLRNSSSRSSSTRPRARGSKQAGIEDKQMVQT